MFLVLISVWLVVSFGTALMLRGNQSILEPNKTNSALSTALLVLPVFALVFPLAGLRPESAGGDTSAYLYAYQRLGSLLEAREMGQRFFGNTEWLWWPLQSLAKPYLSGPQWLAANFIAAFMLAFLAYWAAARRERINPYLFCLAFLTFYAVYSGNVMRQVLAVPLAASAFFLCQQRRHVPWLLLSALAIGLHWSAIVVLLAPLLRLRVFDRNWPYAIIPILALSASIIGRQVIEVALRMLGVDVLSSKFDFYASGARESHLVSVWQTANFWLCVVSSVLFFALCRPSKATNRDLHAYVLLIISVVLLTVSIADLAERYLPYMLLVLPLIVAAIVRRFAFPEMVRNAMFLGFFIAMGVAVYFNPSAQTTLGYTS